jgi:hypothetical protein
MREGLSVVMHGQQETHVMHAKELGHGENYPRVPRKDSECSKHQVKKY